jgi:hypothetical protein
MLRFSWHSDLHPAIEETESATTRRKLKERCKNQENILEIFIFFCFGKNKHTPQKRSKRKARKLIRVLALRIRSTLVASSIGD